MGMFDLEGADPSPIRLRLLLYLHTTSKHPRYGQMARDYVHHPVLEKSTTTATTTSECAVYSHPPKKFPQKGELCIVTGPLVQGHKPDVGTPSGRLDAFGGPEYARVWRIFTQPHWKGA